MIITGGLPIEKIREVSIIENNEPLVEVLENEGIQLLSSNKYLLPMLRKRAADRLTEASRNLPPGHKLLVVTAYRPISIQKKLYTRRLRQMAFTYPWEMIFDHPSWKKRVARYTAPPGGSSHQCGAAVDVTIIGPDGKQLDMGTPLNNAFGEKVHMYTSEITDEQKQNRKILYDAMIAAGFINYPLEWWHYSYGDRMWAAYSGRPECFYGRIEE